MLKNGAKGLVSVITSVVSSGDSIPVTSFTSNLFSLIELIYSSAPFILSRNIHAPRVFVLGSQTRSKQYLKSRALTSLPFPLGKHSLSWKKTLLRIVKV